MRQLHLPLAFTRPGASREDIENQLRAIDHLALEPFLELAQLRRVQFVVEDHDVDIRLVARRSQRGNLARANEGCGVRPRPLLQHAHDNARACGIGEARELVERMIRIAAARRSD